MRFGSKFTEILYVLLLAMARHDLRKLGLEILLVYTRVSVLTECITHLKGGFKTRHGELQNNGFTKMLRVGLKNRTPAEISVTAGHSQRNEEI